jgi:hypothetical protein
MNDSNESYQILVNQSLLTMAEVPQLSPDRESTDILKRCPRDSENRVQSHVECYLEALPAKPL